jgi:hypothetical protein
MPEEVDLFIHCPHLGRKDDAETWFGFPADENHCHRPSSPQSVALAYQSSACLSEGYQQCQVYQHQGRWPGTLPDGIRPGTASDTYSAHRWNAAWMGRLAQEGSIIPDESMTPGSESDEVSVGESEVGMEVDASDRVVPGPRARVSRKTLTVVMVGFLLLIGIALVGVALIWTLTS